jgi:hypothetical protein
MKQQEQLQKKWHEKQITLGEVSDLTSTTITSHWRSSTYLIGQSYISNLVNGSINGSGSENQIWTTDYCRFFSTFNIFFCIVGDL